MAPGKVGSGDRAIVGGTAEKNHPEGARVRTHESQDLNELAAEKNRKAHYNPMRQGAMDEMARKRWDLAKVRMQEEEELLQKGMKNRSISASDWLLGIMEPAGPQHDRLIGEPMFKPPARKPKPLPRVKDGYGNPKQDSCGKLAIWYSNNLPHAKQRGSDARRLVAEGKLGRLGTRNGRPGDKVYRPFDSWTGTCVDPVHTPGVKPFDPNPKLRDPGQIMPPNSLAKVNENCMSGNWPRPEGAPAHLSLEMALAVQKQTRPEWKAYCDGRPPWKGWGESIGAFSLDQVIKRGILHDPVWALDSVRFRSRELWKGSPYVGEMGRWAAGPVTPPEPWMARHPYRGASAPETEEERLVKIFNLMDIDGSGAISGDELANAMGLMGLKFSGRTKKAIMLEMDEDGSGEIDLEEFLSFFRKLKAGSAKKEAPHLPIIGMWARTFTKEDWRSKEERHVTLTGPGTAAAPVHARMRSGSPTRWPGWPKPPWKGWGANYGIFSLDNIIKRGILHQRTGAVDEFTRGQALEEARAARRKAKQGGKHKGFLPDELRVELPLGVTAQAFNTAEAERVKLDKLRRAGVLGNYFLVKKVMAGEIKEEMAKIMDEEDDEDVKPTEFLGFNFRRLKSAQLDAPR